MQSIIGDDFYLQFDKDNNANPHRETQNKLSMLEAMQRKVQAELVLQILIFFVKDLMPVKEYSYNRVKHGNEDDESQSQIKVVKPQKSILEEDFFVDPEEERERYLKMFLPEYSSNAHQSDDSQQYQAKAQNQQQKFMASTFARDDGLDSSQDHHYGIEDSSFNDRQNEDEQSQSLEEIDFQLTMTQKGQSMRLKQNKLQKSVTFKDNSTINRENLPSIAQQVIQERLQNVQEGVKQIYERNKEVESKLSQGYSCDNTQVLEVILEHILFHWDDIMDVFIDDLIEEEALELNKIEEMRNRGEQSDQSFVKQRKSNLADKSLHGKYHDYRSVDLRDILKVFEDYKQAETSIRNRLM